MLKKYKKFYKKGLTHHPMGAIIKAYKEEVKWKLQKK